MKSLYLPLFLTLIGAFFCIAITPNCPTLILNAFKNHTNCSQQILDVLFHGPEEKQCQVPDFENGHYRRGEGEVHFTCDHGHYLSGSSIVKCMVNEVGDNVLESDPPICDPLPECPIPKIENSEIKGRCCFQDDAIRIVCNTGYELIGNEFLKCLPSRHWNDTLPECKPIIFCKDPGIPLNGACHGLCFRPGCVQLYWCDEGFEFENKRMKRGIRCLNSGLWSGTRPKCKPKDAVTCEIPNSEDNNMKIIFEKFPPYDHALEVYLPESEIEVKCKEGYESEGLEGDERSFYCENDGNWDNKEFLKCLPKYPCKRPREPSNGKIEEFEFDDREEFPVNFEINFVCDEGYRIKNGEYGSKCLGNDKWLGGNIPNCSRIACSNPGIPENGNREGDSFISGAEVKFSCLSEYELIGSETRVCQLNGQWSGKLAICDRGDTYCPNPGIPINGKRNGNDFNLGDEVSFSCGRGFYLLGNATRYCLEEKIWSGEEVFCKGNLEFTKIEDASELLEETMGVAARMTVSSPVMASGVRAGIVNVNSVHGVNLIFVFDGSGSINEKSFKRAQLFAEALIRKVGVSQAPGGTRVAAILFSGDAEVIFQAAEVNNIGEALEKLKKMDPPKKGTNIVKALTKVAESSSLASAGRSRSKSVAFLLTDGNSNEGGDPEKEAKKLVEQHDVELYVITIGSKVNEDLVKRLAPLDHVINLANYKELFEVIALLTDDKVDYSKCGQGHAHYGKPSPQRIVGGRQVRRSWPWMAALRFKEPNENEIHLCGGSIISKGWILTAAHCFKNNLYDFEKDPRKYLRESNWRVRVGMIETVINDEDILFRHSFEVSIAEIILHEIYKNNYKRSLDSDIALLRLKTQLSFDVFLRPVCLPPRIKDLASNINLYKTGETAVVVGWGYNVSFGFNDTAKIYAVEHANEVEIFLQSKKTCGEYVEWTECKPLCWKCQPVCQHYKPKITENMLCAGTPDGKKDSCLGDSGGPLMQWTVSDVGNWTEHRWIEVGLVSWGPGCAIKGYYGYYTNVAMFRDWIDDVTKVEFEEVVPIYEENVKVK